MTLVTTLKAAGKKVEEAFAPEPRPNEDMDILKKLKLEHDQVQDLLAKLVDSEGATERRALLKQIKALLVPHTRAEERIVYDAVRAGRDKKMKVDGEEGYLEHALADKTLATLGKISNPLSPEFTAAAKVLKELISHHVDEEERNIWSDVREKFSDAERIEMNRAFDIAKRKVKAAH
jgi:hemerythrin superfamily protein